MIVGANISYIGIWVLSIYEKDFRVCNLIAWLKYLGFAFVIGALIIKNIRISLIFNGYSFRKVTNLTDGLFFGIFAIFILVWIVILTSWSASPSFSPKPYVQVIPTYAPNGTVEFYNSITRCQFGTFSYVCLGFMAMTLLFGGWLTYTVRHVPSAYNESKYIAYALYNWVVIGLLLNAVSTFAVSDPDLYFALEAFQVLITQTGVILLIL